MPLPTWHCCWVSAAHLPPPLTTSNQLTAARNNWGDECGSWSEPCCPHLIWTTALKYEEQHSKWLNAAPWGLELRTAPTVTQLSLVVSSFHPADICIRRTFMKLSLNYTNLCCHLFPVGTLSETPVEQLHRRSESLNTIHPQIFGIVTREKLQLSFTNVNIQGRRLICKHVSNKLRGSSKFNQDNWRIKLIY